jgi:iron(III) transport system substrate-binding protein
MHGIRTLCGTEKRYAGVRVWTAAAMAAFLVLAGAVCAHAADPKTVAKIANLDGPDRQAILEKGAREEGQLLVYTIGSQSDPVLKAFTDKYPFITVKAFKGSMAVVIKSLTEEYRAGVYNADVFELDDYGLQMLLAAKILMPFKTPEAPNYVKEALDPKNNWIFMREDYASLGFNTKTYPAADTPHTLADLLDPKWKDKLAVSATDTSLNNWIGTLVAAEGADYVLKLGKQNVKLFNMGGPAAANLIVSGEVPLLLNARWSHMFARKKLGGNVDWHALGPVYTAQSGVALPVRSVHPHAAMLFIDFMLSKESQDIWVNTLGYASLRKDMISRDAPKQKVYLAHNPNYARDYQQWGKLADKAFRGEQK